jgi:isoleucyl-tRNA synthetase
MSAASLEPQKDYGETLFLPKTSFPMRGDLPKREPLFLEKWKNQNIPERIRRARKGKPRFVLHDGPPYANGHLHMGHAFNKILKDFVVRSHTMLDYDSPYVPGWDCHGLPIEWKVEEQFKTEGQNKDSVSRHAFRSRCREFAAHWITIQKEEFKRLGVQGDWDNPYTTMAYSSEAAIAQELMAFATSGQIYRDSKPVFWSCVEGTALAEAEIEYHDHSSPTVWVAFPLVAAEGATLPHELHDTHIVIWTTTPWTLPANRAIAYGPQMAYSVYEVTPCEGSFPHSGGRYILADALAESCGAGMGVHLTRKAPVTFSDLQTADLKLFCRHPFFELSELKDSYSFCVPLIPSDHVTDDQGTGFVHIAPGHGEDDYGLYLSHRSLFSRAGTQRIPETVLGDGRYAPHIPRLGGAHIIDSQGRYGDANGRVMALLQEAGKLLAKGKLKHSYPYSWRSLTPLILRNTPQWFLALDRPLEGGESLREKALSALEHVSWIPCASKNRISGMLAKRPDWVLSRQRVWGVPLTLFMRNNPASPSSMTYAPGPDFSHNDALIERITHAFEKEGADAWFDSDPRQFLKDLVDNPEDWEPITDILDVWFDSGTSHSFVLGLRPELHVQRPHDGGIDQVMVLEGSDQHRGWFHSSLLESCGTRGVPPYDTVLTHGFVLDGKGEKMSKSKGNVVSLQDSLKNYGADILRLWVASCDYGEDVRIGPEILKTVTDTYRKLRNTLRWMLGALHYAEAQTFKEVSQQTETLLSDPGLDSLDRFILHTLSTVNKTVHEAYKTYDFRHLTSTLMTFLSTDLSAFYFDIRKDRLYCDPLSSPARKASLKVIDQILLHTTLWIAPILPFTAEDIWEARFPSDDSVHLALLPSVPNSWENETLHDYWSRVRTIRRVVTGALEVARAHGLCGSSLEMAPQVFIEDAKTLEELQTIDFGEICITSAFSFSKGKGPDDAFRLSDVPGVAVVCHKAQGQKCQRSWKISPDVGQDSRYPHVTPRDAQALYEWEQERTRMLHV